ncbi:hypothetical protein J6590_078346 [Homalodisca vitripennis]|nr:hypothetical protein J6590_078346 [Homalodisca vitripennis]
MVAAGTHDERFDPDLTKSGMERPLLLISSLKGHRPEHCRLPTDAFVPSDPSHFSSSPPNPRLLPTCRFERWAPPTPEPKTLSRESHAGAAAQPTIYESRVQDLPEVKPTMSVVTGLGDS